MVKSDEYEKPVDMVKSLVSKKLDEIEKAPDLVKSDDSEKSNVAVNSFVGEKPVDFVKWDEGVKRFDGVNDFDGVKLFDGVNVGVLVIVGSGSSR